ncbi:hypothetical protein ACQJBY_030005 [Aegilops geniculata]
MVHCKQPRRTTREVLGVPGTGGRARAGGGGQAVAADPGYMRPTSSSGARPGREVASAAAAASAPAAQPVGAKAAALGLATPRAARPTCASAQKSARDGGGCEGHRACRYAYCTFKGHAPAAPPLGAFLASRRGLIKTEQSMKHRGVSAFRNPKTNPNSNAGGGKGDGFFVQVACPGARPKTASSGSCCSGLSAEEVESPYVNFGRRSLRDGATNKWGDPAASVDGSCGSSDVISDGFAELPGTANSPSSGRREQIGQEEGEASWVDQQEAEEDSGACDRSDISEELGARYQGNNMSKDCGGGSSVDSSMDDISSAFGGMNFQDVGVDPAADAAVTSQGNKLTVSRRRTPRGGERIRAFNPRAPNFLPVVPDPDAEKVDLRHQMTDDRKNARSGWSIMHFGGQ